METRVTWITLVRHGETAWNREGRSQGKADLELTGVGLQQAAHLAKALEKARIDGIYCSPLKRARMTAEAIARPHQLPVKTHPGLMELNQGELEGLTFSEMQAQFPDVIAKWRHDPSRVDLPGGETMEELQIRAWRTVQEIVNSHRGQHLVLVSHNLAILSILCKALELPLRHFRRLRQDVAARTVLEFGPQGPVLTALNDRSHLNASEM